MPAAAKQKKKLVKQYCIQLWICLVLFFTLHRLETNSASFEFAPFSNRHLESTKYSFHSHGSSGQEISYTTYCEIIIFPGGSIFVDFIESINNNFTSLTNNDVLKRNTV